MTIKELEDYQVICSRKSLSKAAKALFITPQGLSRVLKNLESELDCTLVNRAASGLELTESGECLLEFARKTTADYHNMKKKVSSLQESVRGSVDLMMAHDIIRLLGPDCLSDFQRIYPGISLKYREFPDRVVDRMLAEQRGNAALSFGPFSEGLFHVWPLMHCQLSVLAYEGHPLCEKAAVEIEDLKCEPLYLENDAFKINEYVQRKCWLKGFEPNIVFEASSFDICYKMCRMKKGISVVPDFVHDDMKIDGLVRLPFTDPDLALEMAFLSPKNSPDVYAVDKFYNFIKSAFD